MSYRVVVLPVKHVCVTSVGVPTSFFYQIGFILARRRYGRNFMVPRRFQPPKFDYHRPIPPELAEQV